MSKKATIISNCSRNSRSSRTFGSLILLAALLLTACQSDTEDVPVDSRPRTTVELLSYSTPFLEIAPWSTRTDANNDGYNWCMTSDIPSTWTYYSDITLDWYHSGSNAICSNIRER